ncbi:hypothetical protein [Streptomyces zhihengii]|uniref:Uncharacterized protein n=1 Tax=Streptomyces zhihengii TaxID=1818004 RepID=A0ABS2V2Q6_9ACTN|nr:hypothetical protein [Streptomyces zhihengii]MBM9624127.1 hypothetical protein [Streptomyces zhihengii]
MPTALEQWRAAARHAAETDRLIVRLNQVAYRTAAISRILDNPDATADRHHPHPARIHGHRPAPHPLGVADHAETPCALSFLTTAERALTAPSARLLTTADSARAAAACASDDDLRNLLFTDIVGRWRHLIGATHRGWTHVHVVSEAVLDLVAA